MSIGQLKRSALRRALQTCFFDSILVFIQNAPKRRTLANRYSASWKWIITLCALLQQQKISEKSTHYEVQKAVEEFCLHSSSKFKHSHQKLFESERMDKMITTEALAKALEQLSSDSLLAKISPKKLRKGIEQPMGSYFT